MNSNDFVLKDGKTILGQPCVEVVAFASAPATESGDGFAGFLRAFIERYSSRLNYYVTGDMKHMRPFDQAALEGPFHWFANPDILGQKKLGLELHSGPADKVLAPPAAQGPPGSVPRVYS